MPGCPVLAVRCLPSTPVTASSSWIFPSAEPTYTLLEPVNPMGAEGPLIVVDQRFVNVFAVLSYVIAWTAVCPEKITA